MTNTAALAIALLPVAIAALMVLGGIIRRNAAPRY